MSGRSIRPPKLDGRQRSFALSLALRKKEFPIVRSETIFRDVDRMPAARHVHADLAPTTA